MIFGGMARHHKYGLIIMDSSIAMAGGHIDELGDQSGIMSDMNQKCRSRGWTSIPDSASRHTAAISIAYLDDIVNVLSDWPSGSPDLEPTKNIWAIMRNQMEELQTGAKEELINLANAMWNALNTVLDSVLRALQAVAGSKGTRPVADRQNRDRTSGNDQNATVETTPLSDQNDFNVRQTVGRWIQSCRAFAPGWDLLSIFTFPFAIQSVMCRGSELSISDWRIEMEGSGICQSHDQLTLKKSLHSRTPNVETSRTDDTHRVISEGIGEGSVSGTTGFYDCRRRGSVSLH
jgi:hypothetical protein